MPKPMLTPRTAALRREAGSGAAGNCRAPRQAPPGGAGRGAGAGIGCRSIWNRTSQIGRSQFPPTNSARDRRMAGYYAIRGDAVGTTANLRSAPHFDASTDLLHGSAFSSSASSRTMRVNSSAIPPCRFRGSRLVGQTLNAHDIPGKIPSARPPEPALTHDLVHGFGWQGAAAPLGPLLQRRAANFLPLGCAHSSPAKKLRVPSSSTAFRSYGCSGSKPLPGTSHRGRE